MDSALQHIPYLQPAGDGALLVTFGDTIDPALNRRVHALARALEGAKVPGLGEAVPGYATLLVHYDPLALTYAEVDGLVRARLEDAPAEQAGPRVVEIPVVYGGAAGPDLDFVAAHNALETSEVIRRHTSADYPVYMMGFTPGFPYLGGLDPSIAAPRLPTPRSRVPGGSVGIAGMQTGVYPIDSPGGWRIIGRTPAKLFDPRRDPPFLLAPGDVVRFVPSGDRLPPAVIDRSTMPRSNHPPTGAYLALRVLEPGAMTTVQDLGRRGWERFGVSPAGAMDWLALHAANRLVGNPPCAAGLEFALDAPRLQVTADCLLACTGHGWQMTVGGRRVGAWRAAIARRGEVIEIEPGPEQEGGWGYLAVSGGIDLPQVMGSRSTYLRGGFGGLDGRTLQTGDLLPCGPFTVKIERLAGRKLVAEARPAYATPAAVPVILGPQAELFTWEALRGFLAAEYTVSPTSDRMGYRLSGPRVERSGTGELLSEGIAPGSVQVPPDGQPIVLLADRPTAGGYAKIATVTRAGLPLLAQNMPGSGQVRFRVVGVEEAQAELRGMMKAVEEGITSHED